MKTFKNLNESVKLDAEIESYLESKMGCAYGNLILHLKENSFSEKLVNAGLEDFHFTGKYKKSDLISHFERMTRLD